MEAQLNGHTIGLKSGHMQWDNLKYWNTGEWQVIQERLDDYDQAHRLYNPRREQLFSALDWTPFDKVKVVIYGQDPYPDRSMACGLAFSVPNGTVVNGHALPPTLNNIFKEYSDDLHYPVPTRTDLSIWAERGVLLWNVIPTCEWSYEKAKPLSHDWPEWAPLTEEITRRLSDEGDKVFVFMGSVAKRFVKFVNEEANTIIHTSHPVPRANLNSHNPFIGSRVFSNVNHHLVQSHHKSPIDWRLP